MPWGMLKRTNRLSYFEMSLPVNRFGGSISFFWRAIIKPFGNSIRFTVIHRFFQGISTTTAATAEALGLKIIYPRRIGTLLCRAILVELGCIRWIQSCLFCTLLLRLYTPLLLCQEKVSNVIVEKTTFLSLFLRTFFLKALSYLLWTMLKLWKIWHLWAAMTATYCGFTKWFISSHKLFLILSQFLLKLL